MSGQGLNFTSIFSKYIMFFYLKFVLLSFCTPMDIHCIFNVLWLPPIWDIGNGGWVPGLEAFCIFLYFCACPHTLLDIGDKFGQSKSLVSQIVSMAFKFVYFHIKSILFWDQARLTLGKLNEYGNAISRKSGINHGNIKYIGMIDGTFRKCARLTED